MDPILAIAKKHDLIVIEDACQAHGARVQDKGLRAGSIGHMAAFSFYPGKNLGACGEGGALVTSDPELMKKVKMLRDWGQEKRYHHVLEGWPTTRMDNIQGAILRIKLRHLPAWTEARRAHATLYRELFAGSSVRAPAEMPYAKHVYHIYAILSKDPAALHQALADKGVSSAFHYPIPVHLQTCFAHLGVALRDHPPHGEGRHGGAEPADAAPSSRTSSSGNSRGRQEPARADLPFPESEHHRPQGRKGAREKRRQRRNKREDAVLLPFSSLLLAPLRPCARSSPPGLRSRRAAQGSAPHVAARERPLPHLPPHGLRRPRRRARRRRPAGGGPGLEDHPGRGLQPRQHGGRALVRARGERDRRVADERRPAARAGAAIQAPDGDGWSAVAAADFNDDGMADVLWAQRGARTASPSPG